MWRHYPLPVIILLASFSSYSIIASCLKIKSSMDVEQDSWRRYTKSYAHHHDQKTTSSITQHPTNTTYKKETRVGMEKEEDEEGNGSKQQHNDYLLSVPFYIYEEFLHDENLLNFTDMYHHHLKVSPSNVSISAVVNESHVTFEEFLEVQRYYKHAGDLHFVRAALDHPSRVLNPEDAKIFVVPSLLSVDTSRVYYDPARKRDVFSHLKRIDDFLENSVWFKRNDGADHIALNVFFRGHWILERAKFLPRCNIIQFQENELGVANSPIISKDIMQNRTMFRVFYVATPCKVIPMEEKNYGLTFVGSLHRHKHGLNRLFQDRRNMCGWLSTQTNYTVSACGAADNQCPHTSRAWLGLHARGDSVSANRLFDTLLSGTIPVFTLKDQYHAQPDWYKWDMISYFADVRNETKFLDDIDNMMSNKTDIIAKTQHVRDNMDLFNWQTNVPFDVYMVSATTSVQLVKEPSLLS